MLKEIIKIRVTFTTGYFPPFGFYIGSVVAISLGLKIILEYLGRQPKYRRPHGAKQRSR